MYCDARIHERPIHEKEFYVKLVIYKDYIEMLLYGQQNIKCN